jgi:hypothetical protein
MDNCAIESMIVTPSSFDTTDIGVNTVSLAVFDSQGGDSCTATVTVINSCLPTVAPQNPTHILGGSKVTLQWDVVPQSVACQVKGTRIDPAPGPTGSKSLIGSETSMIGIPFSTLGAGTTWRYQVRCACSTTPLLVTPFSALDTFAIPTLRQAETSHQISLFPNPAQDVIQLNLAGFADQTIDIVIASVDGRVQAIRQEAVQVESQMLALDISGLTPGLYLVTVRSEEGTKTLRFVKED